MSDIIDVLNNMKGEEADTETYTEADTRAKLIDPIIRNLGWSESMIRREPYAGWKGSQNYMDYLLLLDGKPFYVIEAKKNARTFSIPDRFIKQGNTTFGKLRSVCSSDLIEGLDQCCRYTQHCGARYACTTNGREFVFFKPFHPERPLAESRVILFASVDDILKRFDEFEKAFAHSHVEAGSAESLLVGYEKRVPEFAKRLKDVFPQRQKFDIETEEYARILDGLISNFLVDIRDEEAFQRCYVRVPWTRTTNDAFDALLKNQMEVFSEKSSPEVVLDTSSREYSFDALPSGRTIIVHGPIGIGKTSFLRQLPRSILKGEEHSLSHKIVWAHLDLLNFQGKVLDSTTHSVLFETIASKLREKVVEATQSHQRKLDPESWDHLRDIYNKEARAFQKQRFPESTDADKDYLNEVRKYIWDLKEKDAAEHLLRILEWLTLTQKVPVVLILDNSDQLGLDFQEVLYILSLLIKKRTSCVTLIALRTEALASHAIEKNALANVDERYAVERAPLVSVLSARFREMQAQLKPRLTSTRDNVVVALERIDALLDALSNEIDERSSIASIIEAVGNENLRRVMLTVSYIFKLSPKEMDRLVKDQFDNKEVRLKKHHALKGILRAGGQFYDSFDKNCVVPNIYSVNEKVHSWHMLPAMVLKQVRSRTSNTEVPSVKRIQADFSLAGLDPGLVRDVIEWLWKQRLVTVPHMLDELHNDDYLRVTKLGSGLLDLIMNENQYIDEVLWDTHIYNRDTFIELKKTWENRNYEDLKATFDALRKTFLTYLSYDYEELLKSILPDTLEVPVTEQLSLDV